MIFNPVKPTQFVLAVQHPSSADLGLVPSGFGDAVWSFDLKNIVAPPCKADDPRHWWRGGGRDAKVCSKDGGDFVRALEKAGRRR